MADTKGLTTPELLEPGKRFARQSVLYPGWWEVCDGPRVIGPMSEADARFLVGGAALVVKADHALTVLAMVLHLPPQMVDLGTARTAYEQLRAALRGVRGPGESGKSTEG